MTTLKRKQIAAATAALLTAPAAWAQDLTLETGSQGLLSMQNLIIAALVLVVIAVIIALVMLTGKNSRQQVEFDPDYSEPEQPSSRFEQLLAEIQGVSLRCRGGENKGSYRKIEQLLRIYLERTGHSGARKLTDAEIRTIFESGSLPGDQGKQLALIFDRCKQGAEHESEKLDFTASELLAALRQMVLDSEEQQGQGSQTH